MNLRDHLGGPPGGGGGQQAAAEMSFRISSSQDGREKGKAAGKVLHVRTIQVFANAMYLWGPTTYWGSC